MLFFIGFAINYLLVSNKILILLLNTALHGGKNGSRKAYEGNQEGSLDGKE